MAAISATAEMTSRRRIGPGHRKSLSELATTPAKDNAAAVSRGAATKWAAVAARA